jgi:hypothetical protein
MNRWFAALFLCFFVFPAFGAETNLSDYAYTPFAEDFEVRRQAYLDLYADKPGKGPYAETARLLMGLEADEDCIKRAIGQMDARRDCADFRLNGVLRLLYQAGHCEGLSPALKAKVEESILNFKYWPDEPGVDSMCYWSENHYILYTGGGYLAGQLFPDKAFTNSGQTGREKMAVCRPRVLRWLDLRYRLGFSEWLSNTYYVLDLVALLNLVDFAEDREIVERASIVVDLLLADMALNSFRGALGSTHGRAYSRSTRWPGNEGTAAISKLAFGMNTFRSGDALALALSPRYRMPKVLYSMATDVDRRSMTNRQRMGYRLAEAKRWGLDTNRLEDGVLFLNTECHAHPKMIDLTMRMLDEYNWWENSFFGSFKKSRGLLEMARESGTLPQTVLYYERDVTRTLLEEVNVYTHRTPDYMLSSAQDHRPGYGGAQQHIWQATLGPETVCFTTQPVGNEDYEWTGSGTLPRVAQSENVLIALYDLYTGPSLYVTMDRILTHAWFPKDTFDEVVERGGWFFGRRGDGYIALWSQQPCHWQEDGPDKGRELIAPGKKNIWICELGRQAAQGSFEQFMDGILGAKIETENLQVSYDSPSQGGLEFSWDRELRRNGAVVPMDDFPRFDNPYAQAPFPGDDIRFECNGGWLHLNWNGPVREASAYVMDLPAE